MIKLIFKKIIYLILMLFIISVISFVTVNLAPNSFFASGELNPNITEQSINELKAIYNLDKPLPIQFYSWFINLIQLDFGISFTTGEYVKKEILNRLPITLIINITSIIFIFFISLYLGIKAARNKDSFLDKCVKQISILSFSMPSFYFALLLIFIFSLTLEITPIAGVNTDNTLTGLSYIKDLAWHLILPISVITFGGIGSLTLYIRSLTLEILKSDYIFFSKSRGLNEYQIMRYYILPNLYPTIITILGLSLPGILGGSVILENIFAIDGMGLLFFQAALSHDYPIIMGIIIIGSFLTILGNILADLILLKLNPNIQL